MDYYFLYYLFNNIKIFESIKTRPPRVYILERSLDSEKNNKYILKF